MNKGITQLLICCPIFPLPSRIRCAYTWGQNLHILKCRSRWHVLKGCQGLPSLLEQTTSFSCLGITMGTFQVQFYRVWSVDRTIEILKATSSVLFLPFPRFLQPSLPTTFWVHYYGCIAAVLSIETLATNNHWNRRWDAMQLMLNCILLLLLESCLESTRFIAHFHS